MGISLPGAGEVRQFGILRVLKYSNTPLDGEEIFLSEQGSTGFFPGGIDLVRRWPLLDAVSGGYQG